MCSSRGIHRAILGLASTFTPLTVRRRDRLRPDFLMSRRIVLTCREALVRTERFLRPGPRRALFGNRVDRAAQCAFVGSTRSTHRIGSDVCDVRLEAIERILSIFPIWPGPRPRSARRLNTMSWVDRQAQWLGIPFGARRGLACRGGNHETRPRLRIMQVLRHPPSAACVELILERDRHPLEHVVPDSHRDLSEQAHREYQGDCSP